MNSLFKDQQQKVKLYFALITGINLTIVALIITGIVFGIKGYLTGALLAYKASTCCGSICFQCFFTLHTLLAILPWVCIGILFTGICLAIYKALSMVSWNLNSLCPFASPSHGKHPHLEEILPRLPVDNRTVFFVNSSSHFAFTSGLLRPRIYVSSGICSHLTANELLMVILHEMHHKENKTPLQLFFIQILCAINFFLPINRVLMNLYSSASEKAADDRAVNISGKPLELASALVKLCKANVVIQQPSAAFSQEKEIIEERIKRLLELPEISASSGRAYFSLWCVFSFLIIATICFPLFNKSSSINQVSKCKTRVCHVTVCE